MLISVNSVGKSFADEVLFENVSFSIDEGDKIGFVGANGAGKSTLVKILMGEKDSDGGSVFKNKYTKIGYLEQYACSNLSRTLTEELLTVFPEQQKIEEELEDIRLDLEGALSGDSALIERQTRLSERYAELGGYTYKSRIRASLLGLGFSEEELGRKVGELSGGQKTRVALAKILLSDCNLLFLDEPTNHLDIDAREALEEALEGFEGTILAVSHDRYFINKLASRIVYMTDKGTENYIGNYDYFLEKRTSVPSASVQTAQKSGGEDYKMRKQLAAKRRKLENDIQRMEDKIAELETAIDSNNQLLATEEIATDYVKAAELSTQNAELTDELDGFYSLWEELSAQLAEIE